MRTPAPNGGFGSSTLQQANEHMAKAVFGPITEGSEQVAGLLSPFGLTWTAFVPAPLWPAFLGTVYAQGARKGFIDAPKHYLEAMSLYVKAATEGSRVALA